MNPSMFLSNPSASQGLAADAHSLSRLKYQSGDQSPAAIKEAAKQFESLFMRELIKSMREATMKSGMNDSAAESLSTDLLDQQLALTLSGQPGGLSDLIAKQLGKQVTTDPASGPARGDKPLADKLGALKPSERQAVFVQQHQDAARRVQQTTGLPASHMIGQAGHESGWGKREIKNSDGSTSFNLFGIKATGDWKGKVAEVTTTEYVQGVAKKVVAKFRAYTSYEESFRDFARLINESPRYARVRQASQSVEAYAGGLQRAGYATDPDYASKLTRAINSTLRVQRLTT